VLKKAQKNAAAKAVLGRAYHKNGQDEFAKYILGQAIENDPNLGEPYFVLAEIALSAGEKKVAITNLKKAVELNPYLVEARNNLAVLFLDGASFEEAATHLEAAVKLAPKNGEVLLNLGEAYRGQKKWKEAVSAYEKAQDLGVPASMIYLDLALLYFSADVIEGMSRKEILLKAQAFFIKFRDAVGAKAASQEIDIDSYLKRIDKMIKIEDKKAAKAKEPAETKDEGSGGAEGGG